MAAAVLLLFVAGSERTAYADELVRMTMDARLRARPAERAPTVVKVDEGDQVKILARKGRWLKVSFKGNVGWVTRTQVEDDVTVTKDKDEDAKDSKTNKRKGDSGFDTLDEDARGEDGISQDAEGAGDDEDEAADAKDRKGKKGKKDGADGDDEGDAKEAKSSSKDAKKKKSGKADSGGPVTVGARVAFVAESPVRLRPNAKADALFKARRGEIMEIIVADDDDAFVRVLAKDGSKGWVDRKVVALADSEAGLEARDGGGGGGGADDENPVGGKKSKKVASNEDADADEGDEDAGDDEGGDEGGEDDEEEISVSDEGDADVGGGDSNKLRFGVNARVGLLAKAQAFTSGGTGIRSNYKLSNSAPAVHIMGLASKGFGSKYVAQVEGIYMRTLGGKGITVADGTTTEQLGWVTQAIDLRVLGGYKLSPKYTVAGVVGYHVAQIIVQESVLAALPGEAIKGIRVGAEVQAPRLTSSIGVRGAIETLVGGKLTQQDGMKDGESSSMAAYYLTVQAMWAWKPKLIVQAAYLMSYETFAFSGASERAPTAADGARKDLQHLVLGGVGYVF